MKEFDKTCLALAIAEAKQSFEMGNYPVGAVLAFDDKVAGSGNNTAETSRNYIHHAETALIMDHGQTLLEAAGAGQGITLYSTLEPCIMCLGVAIMNKVGQIIYVQSDPHAGACSIDRASLGVRYQEVWPNILHVSLFSQEPKRLIIKYLQSQIQNGIRVEWSERLLKLIEKA